MRSFADNWVDSAMELDPEWTYDSWLRRWHRDLELERQMAQYAEAVPRRLGGDATQDELADDKLLLRRLQHLLTGGLTRIHQLASVGIPVVSGETVWPDGDWPLAEAVQRDWPARVGELRQEWTNARRVAASQMRRAAELVPHTNYQPINGGGRPIHDQKDFDQVQAVSIMAGREAQRWCSLLQGLDRIEP